VDQNYQSWLPNIISIAEEAAKAILTVRESKSYQISSKSDHSPVTTADMQAHHIIEQGLRFLDPAIPCLSEEGEPVPFEVRTKWSRYWLVDPLDGTQDFIQGGNEFVINIALIENHIPVLGVICVPCRQEFYCAVRGGGATLQTRHTSVSINTQQAPRSPIRVVQSHNPLEQTDPLWQHLLLKLGACEIRLCSSALKICLVAKGEADIYPRFGPTCEWDIAAGQCLLEAAGGQLVDLAGQSLRYNLRSSLENSGFYALATPELARACCG